jgi:hypothetical protein
LFFSRDPFPFNHLPKTIFTDSAHGAQSKGTYFNMFRIT